MHASLLHVHRLCVSHVVRRGGVHASILRSICESSGTGAAERARQAALQRAAERRGSREGPPGAAGLPPSLSLTQTKLKADVGRNSSDSHNLPQSAGATASDVVIETQPALSGAGRELVLSPPALVVTREFEWGNIVFGFEQANKYTIRAAPGGQVVGFIAEEDSIGKSVVRNVLRRHRSFKATVLDKHGDPVFVIRRPFYVVSSNLYVDEPGEGGKQLGQVEMSWHLWRRRYSLFAGDEQFAECDEGFLSVDFSMKNEEGKSLARLNRDFTGFAREIFTDAGQYVLRLDPSFDMTAESLVRDPATIAAGNYSSDAAEGKLDLAKRAVLLASAISIDFDYFSRHSRGHGGFFGMPMPVPGGGVGGTGAGAGGAAGGAAGGNAGGAGAMVGADAASEAAMGGLYGEDEDMDAGAGTGDANVGGDPGFGADGQSSPDSEWATFEEPDMGFQDDPSTSGSSDPDFQEGFFGGGGGDDSISGGEEGGGISTIFSLIRDFFSDD